MGIKILPKTLASDIPVEVTLSAESLAADKPVDLVIVDDNKNIISAVKMFLDDAKVDAYFNPFEFLNQVGKYPKHTKILIDYDFKLEGINGIEIAWKLNKLGFQHLYLFTGVILKKENLPSYLKVIEKQDTLAIQSLVA
jgi:PleD family two-component response regulator